MWHEVKRKESRVLNFREHILLKKWVGKAREIYKTRR